MNGYDNESNNQFDGELPPLPDAAPEARSVVPVPSPRDAFAALFRRQAVETAQTAAAAVEAAASARGDRELIAVLGIAEGAMVRARSALADVIEPPAVGRRRGARGGAVQAIDADFADSDDDLFAGPPGAAGLGGVFNRLVDLLERQVATQEATAAAQAGRNPAPVPSNLAYPPPDGTGAHGAGGVVLDVLALPEDDAPPAHVPTETP